MRWNSTCELVSKSYGYDDEGVPTWTEEESKVYCNEYTVGVSTWQFYHEQGVSDVAELQLRTCDYAGQKDVVYKGKPYSVENASAEGDFTRLVLKRQLSDETGGEGD